MAGPSGLNVFSRANAAPLAAAAGVPAATPGRGGQVVALAGLEGDHKERPEGRQEAEHPVHHGRRHRLDAAGLLPPRPDGRRDAQHRPHRAGRRHVHALLRRVELHRRALRLRHRHEPDARGHAPAAVAGQPSPTCGPAPRASAKFLLDHGYTTGQFGKNHLGDHPDSLPTAHGFQEFWGYLYHLDAMQQVSFPDINKSPTEQAVVPPMKMAPDPRHPGPPRARSTRRTACAWPPRARSSG